MNVNKYKSPLHQMAATTATDFCNDSCSIEELGYAIEHGAVGATSNPTIVLEVLKKEMPLWKGRLGQLISENSYCSEDELAWMLFQEITVKGAALLEPVFERQGHLKGRLSIQTNPANYRNAEALTSQALQFSRLGPNMQVKLPVTSAGVHAIEEATYHGVNINATVCFSVPQALAVAEAVERGLARRSAQGQKVEEMRPVCTIMVGRLDDWLQVVAKRDHILTTPGATSWAGVAALKKAYMIYQQRGYRTRLLAAAYRHQLHWTEFIGGDVVLTIPYNWQKLFNASDLTVDERMQNPVPAAIVDELYRKFSDFRRAYDEDGMTPDEFDGYGATVRTLRGFNASVHELVALVRDHMLPNPDLG
jgi:transaldolase